MKKQIQAQHATTDMYLKVARLVNGEPRGIVWEKITKVELDEGPMVYLWSNFKRRPRNRIETITVSVPE